jgi:ferredoxin
MTTIKRTKDTQYIFVLFIVVIVLSVLRPFHCGQCIVCPSSFLLWSWYCLFFVLFIVVIVLSVLRPRRTDNTMTTIKRTKDRQYNDHNKKDEGQTIQSVLRPFHCGQCIVCPSSFLLWSWYCLSFVLFIVVIVLSVLRPFYCGHCIVCPSSTMTTIKRTKDRQYNDHNKKDEGQTMQ